MREAERRVMEMETRWREESRKLAGEGTRWQLEVEMRGEGRETRADTREEIEVEVEVEVEIKMERSLLFLCYDGEIGEILPALLLERARPRRTEASSRRGVARRPRHHPKMRRKHGHNALLSAPAADQHGPPPRPLLSNASGGAV